MNSRDDVAAVCFGKLPIAGDFLHGDAAAPELRQLDQWIQDGLHRSQSLLGSSWQVRFDALPPARFLWCPEPGRPVLAGIWRASRDAAGRRYPFLFAARIAASTAELPLLPLALTEFFATGKRLLDGNWHGLDAAGAIAAVHAVRCHVDFEQARLEQANAAAAAPTSATWAGVADAPELLFHDFAELTASASAPRFGLRWPTRGENIDVSFWLSVLNHFGRQPTFVMWHSAAEHSPGSACAALSRLEPRMFPGLVFPDLDDEDVYDLGRDHGDQHRLPAAKGRFAALVANGTQGQLLTALQRERR